MRSIRLFNDGWLFIPQQADETMPDSAFQSVILPHTNQIFPHQGFHDYEYQFISTYRKRFPMPDLQPGQRVYLDFDGAMIATTVTINGHTFPEHKGGYTPFSFDITDYLQAQNLLTVHLDSCERPDIPPFGYVVDYLTFGGIYRDVWLRIVDSVHITNMRVLPDQHVQVFIRNQSNQERTFPLTAQTDNGATWQTSVTIPANHETVISGALSPADYEPWTLDNPRLYTLTVKLGDFDEYSTRFGVRDAVFKPDGFYLNGEKVMLRGLNRHQTYPYIGAAAPARLQRKDADIIKFDLGCNIVRTSHYPQSKYFLDRCDEIGLLVLEEIPGWQHIGDTAWQQLSLRDVKVMIERDWNHPSIVLWGVRINESLDNTAFYTETNRLARELDPTRQTTGTRYFLDSEFLEDVFSYNDFSNTVVDPIHKPHLITEFNGHMFPTKTFDGEERQLEHALRHARIHDAAIAHPDVTGAIAWCAFDYNTHKEFGSGDRICYHGVMDIFRMPKYAAQFYASQRPPQSGVVLHPATVWAMGDRAAGGNDPLYIFSNCDEVDVYAGKDHIGRFKPARDEFPNLPHPPFKVTGLGMRWGEAFGDLHVIGYINGERVAERRIECDGQPAQILLDVDDTEINADGMDMTRITFKLVERYGNRLPYIRKVITFEIDGPGELIGENPFPMIGGQAALYVKSTTQPGTITIRASAPRLPTATVTIQAKPS